MIFCYGFNIVGWASLL